MLTMDDGDRDLALREHIRSLLLNYALTHLTIDYVNYTEQIVAEELGPFLRRIPTTESTLLLLEPTLQEQVASCLRLKEVKAYSENWTIDPACLAFIKTNLAPKAHLHPSADFLDDLPYNESPIVTPLSPILAASSIRQTPKIGVQSARDHTAHDFVGLLQSYPLEQIHNDAAEEQTKVETNDALGHRILTDAATHAEMRELFKSTVFLGVNATKLAQNSPCNAKVEDFLRSESPTFEPPLMLGLPIFTRGAMPGGGLDTMNDATTVLKELATTLPFADGSDSDSEERYKEDMRVISGWHTCRIMSSPTPSLGSSQGDTYNDLYSKRLIPSSPSTGGESFALMDEHLFPRPEEFGRAQASPNLLGSHEKLGDFLAFLEPLPRTPNKAKATQVRIMTSPKFQPSSPHTMITASLVGQPPSTVFGRGDYSEITELVPGSDDSIDLRSILKTIDPEIVDTHGKFNSSMFILREKLDDSEAMLMDVPDLPPPNEGIRAGRQIPRNLSDFVDKSMPRKSTTTSSADSNHSYADVLKKIKGLHSLNMELSWRPFNFGTSVPTHEDLARVTENIQQDCMSQLMNDPDQTQAQSSLASLLETLTLEPAANSTSNRESLSGANPSSRALLEETTTRSIPEGGQDNHVFILTCAERRRLYGLPDPQFDSDDLDDEPMINHPSKRRKTALSDQCIVAEASLALAEPPQEYQEPVYTEDNGSKTHPSAMEFTDDSGVWLGDYTPDGCARRSYTVLADSASGFDGPDDNVGELFADVDPVYFEDYFDFDPENVAATAISNLISPVRAQAVAPASPVALQREPTFAFAPPEELNVSLDLYCENLNICAQREDSAKEPILPRQPDVGASVPVASEVADLHTGRSNKHSLQEFMKLRAKVPVSAPDPLPSMVPSTVTEIIALDPPPLGLSSIKIPDELVDHTILPPADPSASPSTWHRYLASLEFIQRLGIVRALTSPGCKVQLIERMSLAEADIIVDAHSAVVLFPLRILPAQADLLTTRVNQLSWRFSRILVVFELVSFESSDVPTKQLVVDPFSPPVVKAFKKLKRDLEIAEACLNKQAGIQVQFAFPMSTDAAARCIRRYGDRAHAEDTTNGLLWEDRRWLDLDEEDLDERDLAAVDGMNVFAAAVVLNRNTLDEFLAKTAERRAEEFEKLIGRERIDAFNNIIARRAQAMQLPSSSPPTTSIDTSNPLTPMDDFNELIDDAPLYYC